MAMPALVRKWARVNALLGDDSDISFPSSSSSDSSSPLDETQAASRLKECLLSLDDFLNAIRQCAVAQSSTTLLPALPTSCDVTTIIVDSDCIEFILQEQCLPILSRTFQRMRSLESNRPACRTLADAIAAHSLSMLTILLPSSLSADPKLMCCKAVISPMLLLLESCHSVPSRSDSDVQRGVVLVLWWLCLAVSRNELLKQHLQLDESGSGEFASNKG